MAEPVTAAVVIGGMMAAAGAAAAVKGLQKTGTAPQGWAYGYGAGGGWHAQKTREQLGGTAAAGARLADIGVAGYAPMLDNGQAVAQQGANTIATALDPRFAQGGVAGGLYDFDPGAAAAAQSEATIAAASRRTNAIGRTGGALGMRSAITANANAGAAAAQQAAVTRAQADQTRMGYALQNQGMINQTRMGLAGLGAQQLGMGLNVQGQALDAITGTGLTREQFYQNQLADMERIQLQAEIAREQARQQARIDKRRMIVGLGAGLIGGGGQMMSAGMGGGFQQVGGGGGGGGAAIGQTGAGGVTNWGGRA